jgi:hypothetical protein
VPKGDGLLLVPVPEPDDLAGLAKGAKPDGFRDRRDREAGLPGVHYVPKRRG